MYFIHMYMERERDLLYELAHVAMEVGKSHDLPSAMQAGELGKPVE